MVIAESFVGAGRFSENSLEVSWDFSGDHRGVYGDWKAIRESSGYLLADIGAFGRKFLEKIKFYLL